jgi:hypothetical protein
MPELPEVEVLRRSLEGLVLGRRIVRARALSPALREPLRQGELRKLVDGVQWEAKASEKNARIGGSQTRYLQIPPVFLPSDRDET